MDFVKIIVYKIYYIVYKSQPPGLQDLFFHLSLLGITVAKELTATTRAVLDQVRVILIWAVFLIPWGTYLCRVQDYFHFTAVGHSSSLIGNHFTLISSRLLDLSS